MAHWLHEDTCGQAVVRVHIPFNSEGGRSYITRAEGITTRPPRRPVRSDTGTPGFIHASTSALTPALSLGPDRTQARFPDGMPVTLVNEELGTFADATGQVWLAKDNRLSPQAPVHRGGSQHVFDQRQALAQGWARNSTPRITAIPDAETLSAMPKDAVFLVHINRNVLTAQRGFSPDWVDPIEQVIDSPCDEPPRAGTFTPCGRYLLDYRAFGALWFDGGSGLVLVRYTGTERREGEALPSLRVIGLDIPGTPVLSREW
jgi:hypothetical protein